MIVYLFNDDFFTKINLPVKVSGMYPLNVDQKIIANILAENENWIIQLSDEYRYEEIQSTNSHIHPYKVYKLISENNPSFNLVAIPKYDSVSQRFCFSNEITIGNNNNCDIYYSDNSLLSYGDCILKLVPNESGNFYTIEVNSNNFFVSNQRAFTGMKIRSGDYIFFFGLRVIIIGNQFIINNPNDMIKIKSTNIQLKGVEENYTLDDEIRNNIKDDNALYSKSDYFFKSPRFNFVIEEEEIEINKPPKAIEENDMPVILTVGPQLTMASTSLLSMINFLNTYLTNKSTSTFKFIISMSSMGLMMCGTLLWPTLTRKFNKKRILQKEKKRQEKYTKYLEQKQKQLDKIRSAQKDILITNNPDAINCLSIIERKSKELWQRSIDHEDFLSIRLGIGKVSTKLKINIPKEEFTIEEEDILLVKMKDLINDSLTISGVPISYKFTDQSINAIVGEDTSIKEFMDCVFLQMLTFHSYTDLKIVVFTKNPEKWDYLKIAPHCWDNYKTIRYFATTVEELSTISNDLEKIFDARVSNAEEERLEDDGDSVGNKKNFVNFRPYYLFFIDDMTSVRNVSLINKIMHYKRNMGFSILITSQGISNLPSETSDFICVADHGSAIMTSKINDNQKLFNADFNKDGLIDVYKCVQQLANIPIMIAKEKYELPTSLSFLELYNLGRVEQLNSIARWSDNNPVVSLAVPVGIDQSNEIFKMDIHEKAYGPHGLVAGTTGSGKSEWIVTYILSLAVNFSPDEVQFVIIDYKGGGLAKSFENAELGVKLPHLAGTITNLDKSEITRSIAAIESELKRRQSVFNDAREKLKEGSMNIYKYQQCYRKGLVDEPMSHLLIICDEFAELKQQQPEFMEQLISTSRIGRSLGIHLILATQKPSGVVNDQIWSNSKFKVCLKVQDKSDSNEMLKKPDAAFLKQTGAFYLQVGNDDYYNLGQSAWAGAKYYPSDVIKHKIDSSIQFIDNLGRTLDFYEEKIEEKRENKGEELLNIVAYLSDISKQVDLKLRTLWLENVSTYILFNDLLKRYNRMPSKPYKYNIAIGEYDEPREQKQGLLEIDLSEGNIAIIGQNGSGIETFLSTIIWSSICEKSPYELAYYIIDFGSETLKKFSKFPQVGEVIFQDEINKVAGILDLVLEELDRRKEILSEYNGSFQYYNKVSKEKMHLIAVVINSFDIFSETLPKLNDLITNLFRDAPKYGIIFIVSANSQNALRQRQLQYFNHIIPMQFTDDSQYRNITNCRRGLIPKKTKGRGLCKVNSSDLDSYCEFQSALISPEEQELELIKAYANKCVDYYKYKVKQLAKIPDDVTSDDLGKFVSSLNDVPIGINFYEKDVAKYDFLTHKIHMFTGKSTKENMGFIYGLISVLSKVSNVKVRVIDMLDLFKKPILDIKLFNEELNPVFAALEKDILTRSETQDYAINIILGISQYKRKLSKGGVEIFKNLFDNIPNSKKTVYILVDDYDKIRSIKLEKWYEQIDSSKGLWFGQGFANQSIFTSNPVSNEDKKYNYKGLAFNILNGEYKVIKTLVDGEE